MPYSSAGRRLGSNGTCPHRMPHPALWERGTLPRSEGLGGFLAKRFEAQIAKQLWGASLVSELSPGATALPIPGWLTHHQVLMASSCGWPGALAALLKSRRQRIRICSSQRHADIHLPFYSQFKENICCPWAEKVHSNPE